MHGTDFVPRCRTTVAPVQAEPDRGSREPAARAKPDLARHDYMYEARRSHIRGPPPPPLARRSNRTVANPHGHASVSPRPPVDDHHPDAAMTASPRPRPRRRRHDKPPVAARLILDHHIKTDVGTLSQDLFADLFPHVSHRVGDDGQPATVFHVAVSPWMPDATPLDTAWSIVPIVASSALAHSTLHFSPSSPALQTFALALQLLAPSKLSSHSRSGIEILLIDVSPIPLDKIFVSIESESTKRLENGQGHFHRHHPGTPRTEAASASSPAELLEAAIRSSISSLKVVHEGDLFPLPLAPHHVTHVPPNPASVLLCEPVAQGLLSDSTKIIVMRGRAKTRQARRQASINSTHHTNGAAESDEYDDAHTDQFFSAAEDRARPHVPSAETETATETESDLSGLEQDDNLSDSSMDDLISLQAPALPPTGAGTLEPGTPATVGTMRGRKTNGAATPASVFSNYTSVTAKPGRPRGRLFKAQGLLRQIPSDLLHPKPASDEDDEARIYVDMSSLPKIGCFSGDWARIETAEEPPLNGFGAFGLGSFGQAEHETPTWRPVRVYGLPEGYSQRPVTRISSSRLNGPGMSFESQVQRVSSPVVHVSPILLANLENTAYLRVCALKKPSYQGKGTLPRFTSASHPPYAKDIGIHHVRTPISAERAYQTAVLGGLKRYFAQKTRVVRAGDLIAVPVDARLGRILQEGPGGSGSEVDDVMALTASDSQNRLPWPQADSVAWFKVGHVTMQRSDEDEAGAAEAFWGSVVCINSTTVGMHGTGFEKSRIPSCSQSTWLYYLGLRKAPVRGPDPSSPALPELKSQFVSPLRRQLRELVAAATSQKAIGIKMAPVALLLTSSHRNIGKSTLARGACADIGLHTYSIDAYDILSESGGGGGGGGDIKTDGFLSSRADRANTCGADCCVLLIQHLEALSADRTESTMKEILQKTRVLIATTNNVDQIPDGVRGIFTHELEMGAPDEAEREAILRAAVEDRGFCLEPALNLQSVALKTAALVAGDLVDVVERASVAQRIRLEQLSSSMAHHRAVVTVRDVQLAGGPFARCLTCSDFDVAVEAARKNFSDSIGAPKIPNVKWDDVGGLNNVKEAVTETIQLPLERPELFAKGMKKRSGILFYGPPGTGKTLLAKAIATEYSLNFFSVKGPELLNMYIGESEANVRRVFQRARDARPCVVFFDELDSVAPKRGNQGDSGGVMDRIVSQLLAELDGMSGGEDAGGVFVIGATNRPDLLDPALLRPGRFDKMLYLGVPDTHDKQLTILEALTRKFSLHPSVSLRAVAERLPFTYTGADFYALCSDAMLKAVTRQAEAVDAKVKAVNAGRADRAGAISTAYYFDHYATGDDVAVLVTEDDFDAAHRELIPSVSAGELAHYETVRATFEGVRRGQGPSRAAAPAAVPAHAPLHASKRGGVAGRGNGAVAGRAGKARGRGKGKGKGKAVAVTSDEEFDDDDEDPLVNELGDGDGSAVNGLVGGRGKAASMGFQDGTASDDDGLY